MLDSLSGLQDRTHTRSSAPCLAHLRLDATRLGPSRRQPRQPLRRAISQHQHQYQHQPTRSGATPTVRGWAIANGRPISRWSCLHRSLSDQGAQERCRLDGGVGSRGVCLAEVRVCSDADGFVVALGPSAALGPGFGQAPVRPAASGRERDRSRPWSRTLMRAGSASGSGTPPRGASGGVRTWSPAVVRVRTARRLGYRTARGRSAGPNNTARISRYGNSTAPPGTNIRVRARRITTGSSRSRQIAMRCGPLGMLSA